MSSKSQQIDMLNGELFKKMLFFAIPIGCSNILQQLFNSADSAVVGQFAGKEALAAVGANGPIVSLLVNLFAGLSVGVNVVLANYIGSKNHEKIKELVNSIIPLGFIAGIIIGIFEIAISKFMHIITSTPPDVIDLAILYLRIYFVAMPFILLYNYGGAVLRSIGDTKRPLIALFIGGIINILLNLLLVIKFGMGVSGVAIATVVSNIFSSSIVIYYLFKEQEPFNIDIKNFKFKSPQIKNVISIGLPAGVQGAVFSISNISIQSTINSFGSLVMAGSAAAINFENIVYYMASAFSSTAVTFVSQNFAAKKYDRCKKIFLECLCMGFAASLIAGILFFVFSKQALSFITRDIDIMGEAIKRIEIVTIPIFIATFYEVPGGALRGLGKSAIPAIIVLFGTCIFRLIWVSTVCLTFHKIEIVYMIYPISWTVTAIITSIVYFKITKKTYGS